MFRVVRRGLVPAAAIAGVLSCSDRTPLAPVTPEGTTSSLVISCKATVASPSISCAPQSTGNPHLKSLTVGGQGVYVTLRSTNVMFNSSDSIFQGDITVQNLMAQTIGDSNSLVTGVRVFFLTEPAPPVTIVGDSTGTVTMSGQHYFVYHQSIAPFGSSTSQTWQWNLHGAVSFTFSVLVDAKVEADSGVLRWTPQTTTSTFNGIWGATANAIYAVTQEGSIWRFNGTTWTDLPAGGFNGLLGVWGSDTNDIYAVGGAGDILHYDGKSWLKETSGTANGIAGISGSSSTDIYAVGDVHTILHYNGTAWSAMTDSSTQNFASVWVATSTVIYATGSKGELWKGDGTNWTRLGIVTGGVNCFSVWASSATNVFAACKGGVLLHYNGTTVATIDTSKTHTGSALNAVWGPDSLHIFVAGDNGTVLESTDGGSTWPSVSNSFTGNLLSAWGLNSTTIYTGGRQGTVQKYNGTTLSTSLQEHADALNSVWGTATTNAYAVGGNGVVVRYDGTTWTTSATVAASFLNSVWGSASNDIYTAGAGDGVSKAVIYHSTTGTAWTPDTVSTSGDGNINAVWGASSASIYAVGDGGVILHGKTGGPWTSQSSGTAEDLLGVWGTSDADVWAVGGGLSDGFILHYNGTSWSTTPFPTDSTAVNGVWAPDTTHAFAVSSGGSIFAFNGSSWSKLAHISPTPLIAIWGTSATDVYAAGGSTLLHFNGQAWTQQSMGISSAALSLLSIWGSSSTDIIAVGSGIYHGVR